MAHCTSCGRENPDDARFCSACGADLVLAAPARAEVRKTVTVVFSDVVGSTAVGEQLDPESLRRVMARYFEEMAAVLEHHGGTVEKFIGDAIMAVFGIPQLHEDDALRALRAAAEMRERLAELNVELERDWGVRIETRMGVNTGEVVAGQGRTLATGDAVNVAARLEQAAGAGEILIGDETHRLVRDAVEADRIEPLEAKGKAEPLTAFRLRQVVAGAETFARRFESPLVGRRRELALLRQAYQRAIDEQACHLFTVLGPGGIGKSRLSQEFLTGVGERATVVTGRCLSYGEGITYWPLVEILQQLGSEEKIVEFLEGERDARTIVNTVFAAVGMAEAAASPEEMPWAVRKLLEALAREQPLVVVLEDLQWAEPSFLDLVEHIADWSRETAILLLCIARPELLDERPGWAGGKLNATSILLEPLTGQDSETLIDHLLAGAELDEDVRARIGEAAEGNPLFVEQMVAMLNENDGAEVAVPPTIQALLAARIDRLGAEERMVIERASVVGKEFWLRAISELSPERAQVGPSLQRLVRKELIRPHRSPAFPADDAFRFRHILIRDAVYAGMPKELRAELHERFADWLESERSEFDEIVGYHLEQAYRYRGELGPLDERARDLGRRAGERLGRAGERALARSDMPAASNLLERTLAVLSLDHPRRNELRLGLGDALAETDLATAGTVLGQLIDDAAARGDARVEWRAQVTRAWVQILTGELAAPEAADLASAAIDALTKLGDEDGLARAWRTAAQTRNMAGDTAGMEAAMRQALVHARRAGDFRLETEASFWIGLSAFYGATPVPEALTICEDLHESATTPLRRANATFWLGAVQALGGEVDEGRSSVARGRALYAELGLRTVYGGSAHPHGVLELLAGDAVAAERVFREAAEELDQAGEKGYQSTILATLAEALYRQGRYDEAEQAIRASEAITAPEDVINLFISASVRGKLLARRGEFSEAEVVAREAVKEAEPTNNPTWRGDAMMALAEVLRLAGRTTEAQEAAERALAAYEQKGIVPEIERAHSLVAELAPA